VRGVRAILHHHGSVLYFDLLLYLQETSEKTTPKQSHGYRRIFNKSNTAVATKGGGGVEGNAYLSGASAFTPVLVGLN
jgi:hypothetical protein